MPQHQQQSQSSDHPNDDDNIYDDDDDDHDEISTEENPDILLEFTTNVQENVQTNLNRLRRVNLADGWDSGTSAEEMSDDLMLGLRDGFCGALSSFSSWNSAMVTLVRNGRIGDALVWNTIGLQLPLVAYRSDSTWPFTRSCGGYSARLAPRSAAGTAFASLWTTTMTKPHRNTWTQTTMKRRNKENPRCASSSRPCLSSNCA